MTERATNLTTYQHLQPSLGHGWIEVKIYSDFNYLHNEERHCTQRVSPSRFRRVKARQAARGGVVQNCMCMSTWFILWLLSIFSHDLLLLLITTLSFRHSFVWIILFEMAPRNTGKEKGSAPDEEDVLQAVILADSFNKRFKPLTSNKPRVC